MVVYNTYETKCPGCGKNYGGGISRVYWIPIKTGLGPELVRCPKCGQVIITGLLEWQHMKTGQKIRYGILSVINSIMGSFLLALSAYFIVDRLFGSTGDTFFTNRVWVAALLFFSFVLICLQLMRVELSNRRVEEPSPELTKASFWNWQTNFQFLVLITDIVAIGFMALVFFTTK